jgi:hypothetical protein
MIDTEKILRLFKRFAGDAIDIYGLKCVPVGLGEEIISKRHNKPYYPIEFKIENPNDVSYFYSIVEEELIDIVQEFGEYVTYKFTPEVSWNDTPKFYLNNETKNKIQKVFDSVRKIEFTTGTPFIGYKKYVINIKSVGMKLGWDDSETYFVDNKVKLISATLNGEKTDVIDAVEEYIDNYLYNKETYYETEMYYLSVDTILNQEPLLKADWIATYYNNKFI